VRLFEHADSIQCAASLGSWLFTTARRECLAIIRRSSRYSLAEVEDMAVEDLARGPEESYVDAEATRRVRTAVGRLPDKRRALIHELYYAERPYKSISAHLDIPVGSIGPTRARSLAELRAFLGEVDSHTRNGSRVLVGTGASGR
jgi:RNA polymerase sigma factor (sigma-70 family)